MLKLTRQSDYAILLLESLKNKKDYVPLSVLVNETKLPQRFLARIAAQLVKHKIIESKEGKIGGYKLKKRVNNINLFDFLQIFEGNLSFVKCNEPGYICQFNTLCKHKVFIRKTLDDVVLTALKRTKIKDLLHS